MPSVLPATSSGSNTSQRPSPWLFTRRRRSLAKNSTAAIAHSASERLYAPRALVTTTSDSTSAGNRMFSTPAERECTQRTRGACARSGSSRLRPPEQ